MPPCPDPFVLDNKGMCALRKVAPVDDYAPYHVMRDIKTLLIVAMFMITICVVAYIIAECVKAVARIETQITVTEKYIELAKVEATKAQEETKQAILGHLTPGEVIGGRALNSVKVALQSLSDQLKGDR